ncbi:Stabilin-2 [Cladophialophora carrionii]|uniref:Stabilin-2 n=1 Tax=Cladophialophora carrionii TaxID=86049 RepID=A0A1C1CDK9_9EURO|nr:Stabilin-2 [Cladophialophora carrionii]
MLFKSLAISALAAGALAQDLTTLLANTTELSNLTTYLGLFPDLVGQLSSSQNITLLAPNNEAFSRFLNSSAGAALAQNDTDLIQGLFTYHVLEGAYPNFTDVQFIPTLLQPPQFTNVTGGQVVQAVPGDNSTAFFSGLLNNASSTGAPLNYSGGVIHIIDEVLIIPQNVSETAIQANLTAVAGALTSADLVETVDYLTDVTVFAPNNAAFEAIGSALPNLTTEDLTSILQYHVIQGTVGYSNQLQNGSLMTVQGNNVTIAVVDGEVFVNSARVVVADVLVANGVVHVIDNVLNPNNATATADPSQETGAPAFSGASSASSVPFTSNVPTPTASAATESAPGATGASSSSSAAAMPMKTGAVGAAALFGGAALVMNM